MAKLKINYPKDKFQQNSSLWKYAMVIITIVLICIFLPKQPRFRYEYQKGKPWNHESLTSPYNFAILKTPEELERDREHILKTVQPVYNLNDVASKEQIDQFNTDLNEKWQSAQLDSTGTTDIEDYRKVGNALLDYVYDRGIISLNNRYQNKGSDTTSGDPTSMEYNFVLVHDNIAQQKNTVDCFTIESATQYLASALSGIG